MNMASSNGCSAIAIEPRAMARTMVRWAVLGAAGVIALVIALSHSMTASAADPNCVAINYTTCVQVPGYTAPSYTAPAYGVASGTVVQTTVDPRYCGGIVLIVNEGGNLIDRCPDGTRVYPAFLDYGFGFGGYGVGYVAPNYAANVVAPNYVNNYVCNGLYGCPNGFAGNGFYGNVFNGGNVFPAGGTNVGGVIYYNDNRFCGDGKIAFVPGRGYYCQNGGVLANGFNGFAGVGSGYLYGNYRFLEASQPTVVTQDPAPVAADTTPAVAPATTVVTAAPVAAAPVAAPVVVQAAPAAQMATALNSTTPTQVPDAAPAGGTGVKILSSDAAVAPAAKVENGRDDRT